MAEYFEYTVDKKNCSKFRDAFLKRRKAECRISGKHDFPIGDAVKVSNEDYVLEGIVVSVVYDHDADQTVVEVAGPWGKIK